jgi:hypothetical protein
MAYGTIKECEFKNLRELHFKISILKKDHTGGLTTFKCDGSGFELKYKGEGDESDSPFKQSECTFTFFSESSTDDNFIIDIINADEGDYLIQIDRYINFVYYPFWRGVLIADNAELSDLYYPQPFKMRAIDGISLLKGKKVTELTNLWNIDGGVSGGVIEDFQIDSAGGPTWGGSVYQHRSLVIAALRLIPTSELFGTSYGDTFLYTNHCWENTKNTQTNNAKKYDALYGVASRSDVFYSQSNEGQYKYMNVYDMLKSILEFYNCRLFMDNNGAYWNEIQVGVYEENKTNPLSYVRWRKDHNGQTWDGSGTTADYNIGEIGAETSRYKIAESTFVYDKQIKEINLDVKSADLSIYNYYHNYADNPTFSIGLDPNPQAGDYVQTNILTAPGANQTFDIMFRWFVERTAAGTPANNAFYIFYINFRVKVGNYWLYYDNTTDLYKWSTTEQNVLDILQNDWWWIPSVGNTNKHNTLLGGSSTTQMDEVPVAGQIEYYAYYQVAEYLNGNVDYNSLVFAGDLSVGFDPNIWDNGPSAKSLEINLYNNGQQVINSEFIVENKPGGTLVEGGLELKRTLQFTGALGNTSNKSIYTWTGTTGTIISEWSIDKESRWRNRYELNDVEFLPVFKGIEIIAFQPSNRKMLRATFYTTGVSGGTIPFRFSSLFEYNDEYYIPNGFTYNANNAMIVGEFIQIEYDLENAQAATPLNNGGVSTDGNNLLEGEVGLEDFYFM